MPFMQRERETLERFCPGLDHALAALSLTELEKPDSPIFDLFRKHRGASVLIPSELGGQGARALDAIRIHRAIGARAPSLAVGATMHSLSVAIILAYRMYGEHGVQLLRNVAAHQHLIASGFAEGHSGRDVFDAQTTATLVSGGYEISGSKKPCSLSHGFDALMLGASLPQRPGQRGIAMVTLEADRGSQPSELSTAARIHRREFWRTPFLAGADSHEVVLDRVMIPEEMMLVPETHDSLGEIERIENGGLCWFELLVCASYLGLASALVERVLTKGAGTDSERTMLGIETESAMAMLEGVALHLENDEVSMDLLANTLFVRFGVQQALARVTAHAAELLGGMSFVRSADVGYLLASSRALALHPPSRLSVSPLLSQYLTGADPAAP